MGQLKPMERYPVVFLTAIFLFAILIPSPAQGLCINPEACGVVAGVFLSMVTVPICLVAFLFAISPKTRGLLRFFAALPGVMAILTGYLMVIRVNRFDLLLVPLIHFGLMKLMIRIGRLDSDKETKNEET